MAGVDARIAAACAVSAVMAVACAPQRALEQKPSVVGTFRKYVSMAPSNTELLYDLGAQDHLAGVCNQCDFPSDAKKKQRVGNFVTPNLESMATLQPDCVFLVDGQEGMRESISKQKAFNTKVILLHNDSIDDIAANLQTLGSTTGHADQAAQLAEQFRAACSRIANITHKSPQQPKVFFCVWPEPLVAIGKSSYLNDAVTICGGNNISGNIQGAYPRFSFEKLLVEQPDVIIMPAEADHDLQHKAPWSALKAVREKHLYFLPARDADRLSRPTLRTLEGLYWLAERIHPELSKALSMSKNSIGPSASTDRPNP